jgi:lipoprotein-anchoring transpeptidase ErfK/SrfK
VTLLLVKSVYAEPSFDGRPLATVIDERPITLVRTTLPVLDEAKDADGRAWLRVRLPGRVFHRKTPPPTGWITASDTRRGQTAWHLVVDVDARRVVVYHDGARKRSFRVIVGKPSTPTPRGEYYVEETMRLPAGHVGAPFALATSARSHVFWSFMGGPGQVALHGVKNVGGTMGTAVSNGCVRMTSDAIVWLAQRIKAGVPLTIR